MNITKGEWKAMKNPILTAQLMVKSDNNIVCHISEADFDTDFEAEANTKLIADAGNTANKCGLLPSELLEQLEIAKNALKEILSFDEESVYDDPGQIAQEALKTIDK